MLQEIWNVSVCRRVQTWLLWEVESVSNVICTQHCSLLQPGMSSTGKGRELCTLKTHPQKFSGQWQSKFSFWRNLGLGFFPVNLSESAKRAIKCRYIYCCPCCCTGECREFPGRECSFPAGWLFVAGVQLNRVKLICFPSVSFWGDYFWFIVQPKCTASDAFLVTIPFKL